MRLRELEIFNALMRAGTTIAAAELLAISQPGVSKAVKHLESQMGVQLFTRVSGRLCPTPEAQMLFRHVRNVFARLETIDRIAQDLRGGRRGVISVASTPTLATSMLAQAAVRFRGRFPDTQIIFRSITSHDVGRRVACGEADFGIVNSPVDVPGIETEELMAVNLVCLLRADHPLAGQGALTLSDLEAYPLISYRPGTRNGTRIANAFRQAGIEKEIDLQTSLSSTACELVEQGCGIALTDPFALTAGSHPTVIAAPVRPAIPISVQLLFSKENPSSGIALRLVDEVRAVARQTAAAFADLTGEGAVAANAPGTPAGRPEPRAPDVRTASRVPHRQAGHGNFESRLKNKPQTPSGRKR